MRWVVRVARMGAMANTKVGQKTRRITLDWMLGI